MRDHMKQKFQWYAAEVQQKLKTTPVNEFQVDVSISVIKNPSTSWIISGWQGLARRPEVAINGFRKSGILDSIDVWLLSCNCIQYLPIGYNTMLYMYNYIVYTRIMIMAVQHVKLTVLKAYTITCNETSWY